MTQPTLPFTSASKTFGNIRIDVDRTTDGGFAVNTFIAGTPHRLDELCFGTFDWDLVQTICGVIGDGGNAGVHPDGIAEAVRDELSWQLHEAMRRRDASSRLRVERINQVLDQLQSPADRQLLAELGEALRTRQVDDRQPAPTVEPDEATLLEFASVVGNAVARGVSDADRPRNFAEWKRAYEAGVARDRAERTGAAA